MIVWMAVRQMGQPRPWCSTSLAHVSHFRPTLWSLLSSNQQRNFFHSNHCSNTRALTLLLHLCFVTLSILLRSRVFQSRVFQPLLDGLTFSSAAFSTPAFWSRVFQSRVLQSRVFSVPVCRMSFLGRHFVSGFICTWNLKNSARQSGHLCSPTIVKCGKIALPPTSLLFGRCQHYSLMSIITDEWSRSFLFPGGLMLPNFRTTYIPWLPLVITPNQSINQPPDSSHDALDIAFTLLPWTMHVMTLEAWPPPWDRHPLQLSSARKHPVREKPF